MYPTMISTSISTEKKFLFHCNLVCRWIIPCGRSKENVAFRRLEKAISKLLPGAVQNLMDIYAALLPRFLIQYFIGNHIRLYAKYIKHYIYHYTIRIWIMQLWTYRWLWMCMLALDNMHKTNTVIGRTKNCVSKIFALWGAVFMKATDHLTQGS